MLFKQLIEIKSEDILFFKTEKNKFIYYLIRPIRLLFSLVKYWKQK